MKTRKQKSTFTLIAGILTAILFNTFIGLGVAMATDMNTTACIAVSNGIGLIPSAVKILAPEWTASFTASLGTGDLALAGLNREIWLAEIMQKFRPDGCWLQEARDLSAYVQNENINLADAGVDPGVIVDYDGVDPIPVADTEDNPIVLPTRRFSTEQDKIPVALLDIRPYDIMSDRTQRHAKTLEQKILEYSATQFAPAADAALTPVLGTTGATVAGRKIITLNDVLDLETRFNNVNATEPKILVLHPTHLGHLKKEDKVLFKSFTPQNLVQGFDLFSFKVHVSTATPTYKSADGTLKAYNAAGEDTDSIASFAFLKGEVGRARGGTYAFTKMADPGYQSHFINFMARFIAVKMRNKGVGAIYATAA